MKTRLLSLGLPTFRQSVIGILIVIGLIIIGQVFLCVGGVIYEEIQPSATEQLLDFAELPLDMPLPLRDTHLAYRIDYSNVETLLYRRFPAKTSKQKIDDFIASQGKRCDEKEHTLICRFKNQSFPCTNTVGLMFSFDSTNRLDKIDIAGWSYCL